MSSGAKHDRGGIALTLELSKPPAHILMVDDDVAFTELVTQYVDGEGDFAITCVHNGSSGIKSASSGKFDVVVLDVGLPQFDGFDVLRRIRQTSDIPVVMLTARGDGVDRILGLEIGADDYVPKPCNLRELVARLRAVLRRGQSSGTHNDLIRQRIGDLTIEPGTQSAYLSEELLPLTAAEFLILTVLCDSAGEVVEKELIAKKALGRRILPYDRSVDVHIGNLRKKLGPLADGRQRIKTVRGRGYLYIDTR
ncbi:MAG: response regulator transcription factor [Pseudomonadota bacterium]